MRLEDLSESEIRRVEAELGGPFEMSRRPIGCLTGIVLSDGRRVLDEDEHCQRIQRGTMTGHFEEPGDLEAFTAFVEWSRA